MGKRTLVHITKDLDGNYKWTGKNAECCIMAVHSNAYVSDIGLVDFVNSKVISNNEFQAICRFDDGTATKEHFTIIENIAKRLKLKIVLHQVKADKITERSSE